MNTEFSFDKMFRPRSVAIVGASPQRGSSRNAIVRILLNLDFSGQIYPITRSHAEVEGLTAYGSVDDLPEPADVALVITPAETVPEIIAQCGRKGIRAAIVFSAGFEETEGGKALAVKLAAAAAENGVTVLGPNCQGLWSVRAQTLLTFGGAAMALTEVKHAPIAIISQSGALGGAVARYLQANAIGCSYLVSVGNETCLDLLDVLAWIVEQDDVRVVALYLEGLNDASRILAIAERGRARGIQIVALKTGRSAVGQEATASHTGKIASSHAVYADVLEQAGVIAVDSLAEMLAAVEVLAFLPDPRASGEPRSGVSVVSSSGGAGVLLADHSDEFGIALAEFSPATVEKLEPILPAFARKANPVDLTGQVRNVPNLFRDACSIIGSDPRTEAMIVQFATSGRQEVQTNKEVFKSVVRDNGIPLLLGFVAETFEPEVLAEFRDAGALMFGDTVALMRSLSWLYRRREMASRPWREARTALPARAVPADWADTMRFCEESGITPAKWLVLGPEDRAETACAGLTYPLVVKVLPSESDHKTELGLVKLRVASPEDVDSHAAEFRRKVGKPDMGVLVQEMVGDGVEVVLSCLRNSDFGPVLSIGSGGIAVELYRDVTHLALPTTPDQVTASLRKLKLWTLLQGFRGKPAADVDALVNAAVRLGDMFLSTPKLREFEVNPLIVKPKGEGVAGVDALIVGDV